MPRATRNAVLLRTAGRADLETLMSLYGELDTPQSLLLRRGRNVVDGRDEEITRRGLTDALDDHSRRLVLACSEGDPVGFALLSLVPSSALLSDPAVRADPLVVARRARRRGVGRVLVGAAATFAEEHGAAVLTVALRPGDRDANRYFARLGFVPAEVRRVAPVAGVRRALGGPRTEPVSTLDGAARRRRLRTREVVARREGLL